MSSVLEGSSDVVAKLPLADEVFDLILELMAVVGVVPYVAVVATILILVPVYSLFPYREGPSKLCTSLTGLKYLSSVGIQLNVVCISCQWS